jgi:hypothetical protein
MKENNPNIIIGQRIWCGAFENLSIVMLGHLFCTQKRFLELDFFVKKTYKKIGCKKWHFNAYFFSSKWFWVWFKSYIRSGVRK